jgi:hypothetical protein
MMGNEMIDGHEQWGLIAALNSCGIPAYRGISA